MDTEFFDEDALYRWEFKEKCYPHFDNEYTEDRVNNILLVLKNTGLLNHPFYPFIRYEIKKFKRTDSGKLFQDKDNPRPIMHTARIDSNIYSYYRNLLMNEYEKLIKELNIDECIIAYRKIPIGDKFIGNKCNLHFSNEAIEEIKRQAELGECTAIALDISKFFDSLDHRLIKKQWCRVMNFKDEKLNDDHYKIFKNVTKFRYIDAKEIEKILNIKLYDDKLHIKQICDPKTFREKIKPNLSSVNKVGIPQGTTISDVIANMYMLDFDKIMKDFSIKYGGYYRRYSDDILFICPIELKEKSLKFIKRLIKITGKSIFINDKKTLVSNFKKIDSAFECRTHEHRKGVFVEVNKPFEYLGLSFDGSNKKIRQSTISGFYIRFSKRIKLEAGIAYKKLVNKGKEVNKDLIYKTISFDMIRDSYMKKKNKYEDGFLGNFHTYAEKAAEITGNKNILLMFDKIGIWMKKKAKFYCNKIKI